MYSAHKRPGGGGDQAVVVVRDRAASARLAQQQSGAHSVCGLSAGATATALVVVKEKQKVTRVGFLKMF